jgi:hypothetical protein
MPDYRSMTASELLCAYGRSFSDLAAVFHPEKRERVMSEHVAIHAEVLRRLELAERKP